MQQFSLLLPRPVLIFLGMENLTSALSLQGRVEVQSELLYMAPICPLGLPGEAFGPQPRPTSIDHSAHVTARAKNMSTCIRRILKGILCLNLPHSPLTVLTQWLASASLHLRLPPDFSKVGPSVRREGLATFSSFYSTDAATRAHAQCALVKTALRKCHKFHLATKWSQAFSRFVRQ